MSRDVGKAIAFTQLIGKQDTDVPNPGRHRDMLPGESSSDLVVDVKNGNYFEGGDTVQGDEEKKGKCVVERDALLHALGPST